MFLKRKLYNDNFHLRKVIPSYLISKHFDKKFNFHSILSFDATIAQNFSKIYKGIFFNWHKYLTSTSDRPSCILSYFYLYCNKNILINNKTVYIASFFNKSFNYVSQLFEKIKQWNNLKNGFVLCKNTYFTFMQLVDCLQSAWKKIIETNGSVTNYLLLNHHVIRKNNLLVPKKTKFT